MRSARFRSLGIGAIAASSILALSACGSDSDSGDTGSGGGGGGDAANAKIAFLMPDTASTRYELADRPLFEKRLKEICPGCSVLYQNADGDASKQQQQAESALAQGVKAIVMDSVDSTAAATTVQKAKAQNVPIIAYDRPIPKAPADYYVSFDNQKLGKAFAQSLVDKVKEDNPNGGILQVNGSPTDAAAGLIKKGMHEAIDPSGLKLLAEYDTPDWAPPKAQDWVAGQITKFRGQIDGVVAANDGTGGASIAAFKAADEKVPPVSGNDAETAAIQRIIAGDQYNTISKPIKIVATAAADVAYAFAKGDKPAGKTTLFNTPSQLFIPKVVTAENVKEVVIDTGEQKAADVCTKQYAADCKKLGIE